MRVLDGRSANEHPFHVKSECDGNSATLNTPMSVAPPKLTQLPNHTENGRQLRGFLMTDSNYTALLVVLDRSGSMSSIKTDMVGGLETMLTEQAALPGLVTVNIVTFDNQIEQTHSFADPQAVKVVLEPRGGTALYDALGWSINQFGSALAALPEHARPGTVQVVVVTDGHENASREYRADTIKSLIEQQQADYNWDFTFLGANQDAVLAARSIGIKDGDALTFDAEAGSVHRSSRMMSEKLRRSRRGDRTGFTAAERSESRRREEPSSGSKPA